MSYILAGLTAAAKHIVNAINLRPATPDDAAAIGRLHVTVWRETYTGIMPDEVIAAFSIETRVAMWNKVLEDRQAFDCAEVFVAESDHGIVGFSSCGAQRDQDLLSAGFDGEIGALYVAQSHQRHGIGRALTATMAGLLDDLGFAAASLWVLRDNAPARSFYEKLGGTIVGEKTDERFIGELVEVAYGWRDLSRLRR